MNLEFVKDLWMPNIFIYNLKTYKVIMMIRRPGGYCDVCLQVIDVLSKLAGLWIDTNKLILYSQATHIRSTNSISLSALLHSSSDAAN